MLFLNCNERLLRSLSANNKYLEEPLSCVEPLQVSPVEVWRVVHLTVWKNLLHVCGPLQGTVTHQKRHSVHTNDQRGVQTFNMLVGASNVEHYTKKIGILLIFRQLSTDVWVHVDNFYWFSTDTTVIKHISQLLSVIQTEQWFTIR